MLDRAGTVYDMLNEYEYRNYEDEVADVGDRGNVVVNIPAPKLPYVPRYLKNCLCAETNNTPQIVK